MKDLTKVVKPKKAVSVINHLIYDTMGDVHERFGYFTYSLLEYRSLGAESYIMYMGYCLWTSEDGYDTSYFDKIKYNFDESENLEGDDYDNYLYDLYRDVRCDILVEMIRLHISTYSLVFEEINLS
jgi:hypothetical protein